MKPAIFFRSKRGLAIPIVIFTIFFSTLWAIIAPVWISIGNSNPIQTITHALLDNLEFKKTAGEYFVAQMKKDASGAELAILKKKGSQISTAVTDQLSTPEFMTNLDLATSQIYNYYVLGSLEAKTVSVRPIAMEVFKAFTKVDPQFKRLQNEIDRIKPIDLKRDPNVPDLKKIHSLLALAFTVNSALIFILLLFYLFAARSKNGFFRTTGIIFLNIGAIDIAVRAIGVAIANDKIKTITNELAKVAAPIVLTEITKPLLTLGILFLLLGALGVGLSFMSKNPQN